MPSNTFVKGLVCTVALSGAAFADRSPSKQSQVSYAQIKGSNLESVFRLEGKLQSARKSIARKARLYARMLRGGRSIAKHCYEERRLLAQVDEALALCERLLRRQPLDALASRSFERLLETLDERGDYGPLRSALTAFLTN